MGDAVWPGQEPCKEGLHWDRKVWDRMTVPQPWAEAPWSATHGTSVMRSPRGPHS